jgi:uncharacterized HAD superfamily protein
MYYSKRFKKPIYVLYKSYIIISHNIKDLLEEEYNKFLDMNKNNLHKESFLYKNLLKRLQESFEKTLTTDKVNATITRFNPIIFKILSLEKTTDYLLEIWVKKTVTSYYNDKNIQSSIDQALNQLRNSKFSIKSENKTFNQLSKDLF